MGGIFPWSRKIEGSNCWYWPSIFNIPNEQHLSKRIVMPDQLHHALKISSSCWLLLTLLETMAAASANCIHEHWNVDSFGPQMVPSWFSSGLFRVTIRVLKHMLNRSGEQGSPCKTPLITRICLVFLAPIEIDVDALLYMLLKSSMNDCGTLWYSRAVRIKSCWTSPKAFLRSRSVITRPLECFFASDMMWVSSSVYSVTPSILGQNPFCFFLSIDNCCYLRNHRVLISSGMPRPYTTLLVRLLVGSYLDQKCHSFCR